MRAFTLFTLPLAALALPRFPDASTLTSRDDSKVPYLVDDECRNTPGHYEKILSSLREAEDIVKTVVKEWWDEGKHREVAALYLGIPDTDGFKDDPNAQRAHANLDRVAHLFGGIPFLASYVHWRCADPNGLCVGDKDDAGRPVQASTKGNEVTMCDRFWVESTIASKYDTYKPLDKKYVTMKGLQSVDTRIVIHELMHTDLVAQDRPHIIDQLYNGGRAYGAEVISDWVTVKHDTVAVINNADSYAIFVMAVYWKNQFGYLPEPDQEDMYHESKDCTGGDGLEYFARGTAIDHVENFCMDAAAKYTLGQAGTFEKGYESGMPEHTIWAFTWKAEGRKAANEVFDKCNAAMREIIDGCETNDGTWKHGGAYTWGTDSGKEYSWTLRSARDRPYPKGSNVGKCDVWYKFFYDEFYIYGGSWAGDDFGQKYLLPNLRRCGVVSEWKFEYYSEAQSDNMEWNAYGRLPIGSQMWDCVRKAVVDSGGPSDIGCGGR